MGEYIPFHNSFDNKRPFSVCSVNVSFKNNGEHLNITRRTDTALEFVVSGKGIIRYGGKEHEANPGNVLFFPRSCNHECIADENDPWVKIRITAHGRLVQNLVRTYFPCDVAIFHDGSETFPYFKKLLSLFKDNPSPSHELDTAASLIIHELTTALYTQSLKQDRSATEKLRLDAYAVKTYIDNNFREAIHVSDLSEIIFRCNSQTIRIFKAVYGMAPYDYIMNLRISSAQQMLEQTNLPIKEIAFSLGFANEHYFSTLFKNKTGLTPSKYRKNTFAKKQE